MAAGMSHGLVATDIIVRFGGLVALDGVGIAAPPGRITGLIGPNGAGKTTLFNVCCGFRRPDAGHVTFNGVEVTSMSPAHRARLGLGRTFQRMELFRSLSVRENIEYAAESTYVNADPLTQLGLIHGGPRTRRATRAKADELIEATGLGHVVGKSAADISTGQGRLLELARALARDPSVLLLDEPSSGLDPAESFRFGNVLLDLVATRGIGILMIEHDMTLVLRVCQHIEVLDFGHHLMSGTATQVRESDVVREAYLGTVAATA
jgi:ABC-type branched-subunit amino acid transport system ATPase component